MFIIKLNILFIIIAESSGAEKGARPPAKELSSSVCTRYLKTPCVGNDIFICRISVIIYDLSCFTLCNYNTILAKSIFFL